MAEFRQELRFALRSLVRHPQISLVMLLTLALGTGPNLAIFAVIRATLLEPLPYDQPDQLLGITWETTGGKMQPISPAELADLRANIRGLAETAAYHPWTFNLAGEEPERVAGLVVTADLFKLLRVAPALGRNFTADGPGSPPEVLLGDALFRRRFAGDEKKVLGAQLELDGKIFTVAGVMPPGFRFPIQRKAEVWVVSPYADSMPRDERFFLAVGRMRADSQLDGVEAELRGFATKLATQYPDLNDGLSPRVRLMRDEVVRDFERNLTLLQWTVAAALILACFNLAILQLGRAESRRGEMALRVALGANRFQILRHGFYENLLLGLGGGLLGAFFAYFGLSLLVRFGPTNIHRLEQAKIGGSELLLAVGIGMACGFLISQIPAWTLGRDTLSQILRPGLRVDSGQKARRALVVLQVALALVLMLGCGLFLRSLGELSSVPLGFEPEPVVVTGVSLPSEYNQIESLNAFFFNLRGKLKEIPGVTGVATAVTPPMVKGFRINHQFDLIGQERGDGPQKNAAIRPVSPGYFEVLQVPLRRGRTFLDSDDYRAEPVVLVNEKFATTFAGGVEAALDRRVAVSLDFGATVGSLPFPEWRIVGVVSDVQQADFENAEVPAIYVCTLQAPWMETRILVQSDPPRPETAKEVERAVRQLLPQLPVVPARSLQAITDDLLAPLRFQSGLLGAFALLALLLTLIGLYGALSYYVARRTREIGLRMALGAESGQTRWMVIRQALGMVVLGLIVGIVAFFWVGKLLSSLLYGVGAADPLTFALVLPLLLIMALAASWLPARRATNIDPLIALRDE